MKVCEAHSWHEQPGEPDTGVPSEATAALTGTAGMRTERKAMLCIPGVCLGSIASERPLGMTGMVPDADVMATRWRRGTRCMLVNL